MYCRTTIRSFDELRRSVGLKDRIVCLYSGGLDGSYLLLRLRELGYRDVVAVTVDLGQPIEHEHMASVTRRFDASWSLVEGTDDFVEDFLWPAVFCHGTYLNGHPVSASLSRPLIVQKTLDRYSDAACVLHTSTSTQNSLRRFDGAIKALGFTGCFGSPLAHSNEPRSVKLARLKNAGLVWSGDVTCSVDENIWAREFESGEVDNPEDITLDPSRFKWTNRASDETQRVSVRIDRGIPTAVDGNSLGGAELIGKLNRVLGGFGHGRYIWLEEIADGKKVQEVREAPAAHLLLDAYRRLESATLRAEEIREKLRVEQVWVREASEGRWFGGLRQACQSFCQHLADSVQGEVEYNVSNVSIVPVSVRARNPRYITDRDTHEIHIMES
ncbi:MAG: argininosuccinate synthase [Gammaproteobacteria bacterium]|nr:argininosuccinate synthase [Gammaproteobacteria bacterium]